MFRWIQTKKWLPDVLIGAIFALGLGTSDLAIQGKDGLIASALFGLSFFFFRRFAYLGIALIVAGAVATTMLGIAPPVGGFSVALVVFLSAAFGKRLWSLGVLAAAVTSGLILAHYAAYQTALSTQFFGISIYNDSGRTWSFVFLSVGIVGVAGFAWLLGGFLMEFFAQRAASKERDIVQRHNLRTMLEMAEQNQRFKIASDINDMVLERFSAMLTLTDGARYAARIDAEVAPRTLDRLVELIRDTQGEIRRLYDMLNRSVQVAAAPPNLNDLQVLAVQLREDGYNTRINHQGERFPLIASAELAIYRIVFDAVDNIKQHAAPGCDVDIDIIWSENGLQVLVKDNGSQFEPTLEVGEATASQLIEEDLNSLTKEVDGPGIRGMRERAGLFQGSVEAHTVPGIGFTLNAIFPSIDEYRATA
ncbi:MAG: sensor histidine kinase [Micrococcales bacterium]